MKFSCTTDPSIVSGERAEVEALRDRVQKLEKDLLLKQMESDRLFDEVKVRSEVMDSGDLVSREAMERVCQQRNDLEKKGHNLERERNKFHEVSLAFKYIYFLRFTTKKQHQST